MKSIKRREEIFKLLKKQSNPLKGIDLANMFSVTRQIIVKDIAILRAEGKRIIATADGYLYNKELNREKIIIAVNHNEEQMVDELEIVVKYGGIIEDVIIEHAIYGEIKVSLMIKNLNDLEKFKKKFNDEDIKPLSNLTNGIHLHTISADCVEDLDLIKKELKKNGFLL